MNGSGSQCGVVDQNGESLRLRRSRANHCRLQQAPSTSRPDMIVIPSQLTAAREHLMAMPLSSDAACSCRASDHTLLHRLSCCHCHYYLPLFNGLATLTCCFTFISLHSIAHCLALSTHRQLTPPSTSVLITD